jgi:hypothetical protein
MLSTDTIDLALNPSTGDLAVGVDLSLSSGPSGVAQAVGIAIALIAGEVFFDLDAGVPYFERDGVLATKAIFGQKYDQAKAIAAFPSTILAVPPVDAISSLTVTFTPTTRALSVLWQAQTTFDDTPADSLALGT